ncbi:MAG: PAS domain S-box protein [Proteobacteria bacterium]|nr:PAS domain S-box protein [Pseudomonadota bacterium]
MVTASLKNSFKLPQFLAVIFILLFISIALTGYLYYRSQKTIIIADKNRELLTLAALKKSEITTWRQERIEDGEAIFENIYFPYRIQEWLNNESLPGHRGEILSWMADRRSRPDYTDALLLDAQGTVRLSTAARSEPIDGQLQKSAVALLSDPKPVLSDLFMSDSAGHIHINLMIPILAPDAGDSPAVGVLVFRIDPHKSLYPLIQNLPIRSATGETLLIRREGNRVRYLNELRHRKNTALTLELPLADQHLPAARAAQGQEGSFAGIDYRGMAVLAAVTAIPDSPWFLVAKIDEDEVLGPFRKEVWFITLLVLALISMAGVSIMLFWRQLQAESERRQYALDLERRSISQQYEYLKKYANDIILLFNEQGTILEANDRAIAAYGYSREELLQLPIRQLRAPACRSSFEADIREVVDQGGLVFETLHQQKNGTVFPVEVSARIMELEGRKLYQSIVRDITERKKAEEEIARRDVLLGRVAKSSSDLLLAADVSAVIPGVLEGIGRDAGVDRVYVFKNHADPQTGEHLMSQLYEWAHESVTAQIDNPELQNLSYAHFSGWHETMAHGAPVKGLTRDFPAPVRAILDPEAILSILLVPINIAGTFWGFIGFDDCKQERAWSDSEISILSTLAGSIGNAIQRHQAEQELISTRDFLENIFSTTADGIMVSDAKGYVLRLNNAMGTMLGFSPDELIGKHTAELGPQDEAYIEIAMRMITDLREQGFIKSFEAAWFRKDGSLLPIELNITRLKDRNGATLGSVSVIRDITERKQIEKELLSTRDFLENIFNSSVDGIIISDYRGYITRANAAVEKMLGFVQDELIGKHTGELLPRDEKHVEMGSNMMNLLFEKGFVNNIENEWLRKDGSAVPLDINITLLKDGEGVPIGAAAFVREITERKNAEEEKARLQTQLYLSQKLEAVGHLAGGIAHDFNNILTAIMGYGSLLQTKLKEDDPLRNHVDQILTSAERAAVLVRSLLAYSRKQIINPRPVKINEIVINVENMLHRIIGEDINLQTVLSEQDTTVVADAGQIEQILTNLATNARDAMPAGGALTIEAGVTEMDEQFIKAYGYGTQGIYVLLTVSDSGSGMDEKTRSQIFEPFFTTKEVGKGTGLGLSTVYGIVKQHNGFINCYSEPGAGTTFKIYLPLVKTADPAVQPSAIATPPVLKGGSETILLAEDDDDLRKLIKQVLEDFGYTVLAAADGDEAVGLFREHHDAINLLLLDVIMPKKNGREAYAAMQKIEPAVKALFTSGYTADIIHKQELLDKGFEFILKPVSPTELLKKVREVLDK